MATRFTLQRHIARPPEEVFDAFSDMAKAPERVSGITRLQMLTDGPPGVGTRFKETRLMMGKQATEEMEITAFERPRSYTLQCDAHGTLSVSTFRFTPAREGTDVSVECSFEPTTMAAKLFSPIAKLLMGTIKKCVTQDMDDLEAYLMSASQSA